MILNDKKRNSLFMTAGTRTNLAQMIIILVTRTCHCNRLKIQLKPNFIRNQPHQSRKRERGKVIVKNRSLIVIFHYLK